MKLKKSLFNLFLGIGTQIITLAMGIIVPRLILMGYGSEVNGLLNTVTQIYGYVALLEAGVGITTIQALYGPIARDDKREISGVFVAAQIYYKRVTLYYFICVVLLSVIGPFAIRSNLNKLDIGIILFLHGLAGVITFYYAATFKQLLSAEGKNYISTLITFFVQMLTYIAKICLAVIQANIVFIQLSYLFITVLQVIVYRLYFYRKYRWIDIKENANEKALKQKNSFMVHQITGTIFNSTDTIVLSTVCGLTAASIYAVYNLVFSGLFNLLNTLFNSVGFVLGQTYHENRQRYLEIHDSFESIYIAFVFAIISVCYVLILPFIALYTSGVTDAVYVDVKLPMLFCLIQLLSAIRAVTSNLINIAQHARQTVSHAIVEAIINLTVSIVAASIVGIYGVLIGTIVALLYRSNDIVIYANKNILNRSPKRAYITIVWNFILFFVIAIMTPYLNIQVNNYLEFFVKGLFMTSGMLILYIGTNIIINPKCKELVKIFLRKFRHRLQA